MMTYCGINCCKECERLSECGGCEQCQGHPFGGSCVAERNKDFPILKRRLIDEITQDLWSFPYCGSWNEKR